MAMDANTRYRLEKIEGALQVAKEHHILRCEANARLHMSPMRLDPLALALQVAHEDLVALLGEPDDTASFFPDESPRAAVGE